jgi:hypothetical protein
MRWRIVAVLVPSTEPYKQALGAMSAFKKTMGRDRARPSNFQRGDGIALGSTSGVPIGEPLAVGDGVGVGSGVSKAPLFVVDTPPESVTSSTRYNSPLRRRSSFASTTWERRKKRSISLR